MTKPCTACDAVGYIDGQACTRCDGTGRMVSSQVCCGLVTQTHSGFRAFCNACGWEGAERFDADVVANDAVKHG